MKRVSHHIKNDSRPKLSRRGFTLIEIIVVIGIIAFLMTIAITTYGFVFATTKEKATKATIKIATELLNQRRDAFHRDIINQNRKAGKGTPEYAISFMVQAGNDIELAKVLGKKDLFRRHFPQLYAESSEISSPGGTHVTATESAEVLYYMLTEGVTFGANTADKDAFKSDQIKDTDGDGRMELVDAWGHPLRFYRWPTRLLRPGGASIDLTQGAKLLMRAIPADNTKDPDDPVGLTNSFPNFKSSYHDFDTYHAPLIVSGGADEELGLYEPNDITNFGHLAQPISGKRDALTDNITNLNIQGGGE